ncbi:MAG: DUF4980 domain-containing protein, partial [Muribaculaceae bacterium]|nr:DUF4980 domain-containing protein [Muribaculaceae bacterium]
MKYLTTIATGLLAVSASMQAFAADGVKVEHLGTNNTIVRVKPDARYILLPVEESIDDATVNLLLDGKPEKTFYVRLARNKVDYYVPVDISGYKDKEILLNVVTAHDRSSVREASEDACWQNISLTDSFDTTNQEKFRPSYH